MSFRIPTTIPGPLDWIDHNERVVGLNHPTLTDVDNRPLREFLSLHGIDPAGEFLGMLNGSAAVNSLIYLNEATLEGKIDKAMQKAIALRAAQIASFGYAWTRFVWLSWTSCFRGYDATLITPSTDIRIVREGGDWRTYDVIAYGADPSGTRDSGPAWNAARAAMGTVGGVLFVPAGTYKLTTAFSFGTQHSISVVFDAGVTLTGAGLPAEDYVNGNKYYGGAGTRFNQTDTLALGTQVSTAAGALTSVAQYTLPAGALGANGQQVRMRVTGVPTVVSGQVQVKFGATAMLVALAIPAGAVYQLDVTIARQSSTTQTADATLVAYDGVAPATYVRTTHTTPGETLSGTVLIDIQALSTGAGGIMYVSSYAIERLHLVG